MNYLLRIIMFFNAMGNKINNMSITAENFDRLKPLSSPKYMGCYCFYFNLILI